jgi:ribosome biogenesis GTPase / thiamine phosphate phosphatase
VKQGIIDLERLTSYNKLQRELSYIEIKADKRAQSEIKKQWKNNQTQIKYKKKFFS